MLKGLLLSGPMYFTKLDVASCYQSMLIPCDPNSPRFVFHVRYPGGRLQAFRLLHLPFGWNASPVLCQRRVAAAVSPAVDRMGASSMIYIDDALIFSRDPDTAELGALVGAQGLRGEILVPHPTESDFEAKPTVTWIGKVVSSRPASISPTVGAARSTIVHTALAMCASMSTLSRQRLTGTLVWAGCQHRLQLPFLQHVHRFRPPRPARPPPSVVDAAVAAAVVSAIPWSGQDVVELPIDGRPRVFFDGVASPSFATAAVFAPPDFAEVLPLPCGTDQQQAEMEAATLAIECAAHLGLSYPVLIGDSASALGSVRRMTCPAGLTRRGDALRRAALSVLRSSVAFSLAWVPGNGPRRNPADPISRVRADAPCRIQRGHPAHAEALRLAASCDPVPIARLFAR